MSEDPHRTSVARAHIASLVFGWGIEPGRLTTVLARGCWPGYADGTRPVSRAWVQRWRADAPQPQVPCCECDPGPCLICN